MSHTDSNFSLHFIVNNTKLDKHAAPLVRKHSSLAWNGFKLSSKLCKFSIFCCFFCENVSFSTSFFIIFFLKQFLIRWSTFLLLNHLDFIQSFNMGNWPLINLIHKLQPNINNEYNSGIYWKTAIGSSFWIFKIPKNLLALRNNLLDKTGQ